MASLYLEVKTFAGGTPGDAVSELCLLADRLGIVCMAEMNRVHVVAHPGDNPTALLGAFEATKPPPPGAMRFARLA